MPLALTDEERAELISRWDRKMLDKAGVARPRDDLYRALMKHGHDPEEARRISASATCAELSQFFCDVVADYALDQRSARQEGGSRSQGLVESASKPSRDRVLAAIRRENEAGTRPSEVPDKVRKGGIDLSVKWIRILGQRAGLLPRRAGNR